MSIRDGFFNPWHADGQSYQSSTPLSGLSRVAPVLIGHRNPYLARYWRGLRMGLLLGMMIGIGLAWAVMAIMFAVGGWNP